MLNLTAAQRRRFRPLHLLTVFVACGGLWACQTSPDDAPEGVPDAKLETFDDGDQPTHDAFIPDEDGVSEAEPQLADDSNPSDAEPSVELEEPREGLTPLDEITGPGLSDELDTVRVEEELGQPSTQQSDANDGEAEEWINQAPPAIPGGIIADDGFGDPTPRDDHDRRPASSGEEPPQNQNWVQISGQVFFNDRRKSGRFEGRQDYWGQAGRECGRDGVRNDGNECARNLHGALHAVVDVFERDTGWFGSVACKRREKIGSATVGPDGRFSVYVRHGDDCSNDDWNRPALALRVRLRYCKSNDVCFSLASGRNDEYALYHPGASYDDPLRVRRNSSYDVGPMVFAPEGQNQALAEDYAIAANYFATLVDTMEVLHREHELPFLYNQYGEVQYLYPSNRTSSATARGPDEVVIKGKTNWIKGPVVAHEYGHILHLRAWDGDDYGWNGVGVGWSANRQQHARLAFKEGFANFISRVVHGKGMRCDGNFDANHDRELLGDPHEGETWVPNVTKMFCDWYDTSNDDDPNIAGEGDHFTASLSSIRFNLKNMWVLSDEYGGDRREGLGMCDYINYYLDVRKSPENVGLSVHNDYVEAVSDLAYQNYIRCDLPQP